MEKAKFGIRLKSYSNKEEKLKMNKKKQEKNMKPSDVNNNQVYLCIDWKNLLKRKKKNMKLIQLFKL